MNEVIEKHYRGVLLTYRELRDELTAVLDDDDLSFTPPAARPLGALCAELAETQAAYVESFRTFVLPQLGRRAAATSIQDLRAEYARLDGELEAALDAVSDQDVAGRLVDRGGGHRLPVFLHLDVYREALLLFYGKASVYLRMMGKAAPGRWGDWIGV